MGRRRWRWQLSGKAAHLNNNNQHYLENECGLPIT